MECHGYYDPTQAQVGRLVDDAQRWHGWPNCAPMLGIDGNWPLARYPEAEGRNPISYWRWEQITDFAQLAAHPGFLWVSDGFEAGTGDVHTLIACAQTAHCRGVFLQADHVSVDEANACRAAGLEVQLWASCAQIGQEALRQWLAAIRPDRFIAQIEGVSERDATVAAINAGVFGSTPLDFVIAGWGDFQAL